MKYWISFILLFSAIHISAQSEFISMPISEELKINANSIILNDKVDVEYFSFTSGKSKSLKIIKVLNNKGVSHAQFFVYADEFRSFGKFKGEVYDALGNLILKIKKSDISMSEYSSSLASGASKYFYTPQIPTYPYYVVYDWEVDFKNGIIFAPSFSPIEDYNQSCVLASTTLKIPKAMGTRFREKNIKDVVKISYDKDNLILRAAMSDIKAVNYERFMPSITESIPSVSFGLNKFIYAGKPGELDSWESYGRWSWGLQEGRDVLPEALKVKVHELTDTCSSIKSKVKILYDYLGDNTRYVSIQLGLGGLQPMTAEKVNRLGVGDCKGLSFFLYSMLKEVGIKSVYVEIDNGDKEIIKEFPCVTQTNHAILQVPLNGDTLWLECTNPDTPFGYVHEGIAGHNGILITDNGGMVCTLPSYPDSLNRHSIKCSVEILPTCDAKIKVEESEALRHYEGSSGFGKRNTNKQIEVLRGILNLNDSQISNITTQKDKSPIPVFYTNYEVYTKVFGKKTGNRLFVPVNIHRSKRNKYDCKNREHKLVIDGDLVSDTVNITLPQGYVIESMPTDANFTMPMGSFSASYKVDNNVIKIVQTMYLKGGTYPATDNEAFADLYNRSIKHFNEKVILRKE